MRFKGAVFLKALTQREAARRLANPGGSQPGIVAAPSHGYRMILVDTSIWTDRFNAADPLLIVLQPSITVWTQDKRLAKIVGELGLAA